MMHENVMYRKPSEIDQRSIRTFIEPKVAPIVVSSLAKVLLELIMAN